MTAGDAQGIVTQAGEYHVLRDRKRAFRACLVIKRSGVVMNRYAIAGGSTGKERLNLLSEVMFPTTSQLLQRVGLRKGMKCLDMGCGGGHVTRFLAEMVGDTGKVVGIDRDAEILDLARRDADAAGLRNVELRCADALAYQEEGEYDLVYARFLLTHLSEPQKCLDAMLGACKPSGVVVIEDIEFTGSFCYPPSAAYERYVDLYQQAVSRLGGDPNIGPKLPGMLRRAGADLVQVNVVQPTHLEGAGKYMASVTMKRIADTVVSEGLASKEEVDRIVSDLEDAAADPETQISLPRIFQSWGRRPD